MTNNDFGLGDVASSALGALATAAGYLGACCLFVGGLATFLPIPFIGQIGYMNGPTGSGFLYIICANDHLIKIWQQLV